MTTTLVVTYNSSRLNQECLIGSSSLSTYLIPQPPTHILITNTPSKAMAAMIAQPAKVPYNNYFVTEDKLDHVPPYFRDAPETREEVQCETLGVWPDWVDGTFVR